MSQTTTLSELPTRSLVYTILAVAVLALSVVPVGTAVFVLGFVHGDSPCVMCWQQRIGMAIIALIGLFVLRYGPRPKYLGLAFLVGAYGVHMSLRHTALHAARDVGQGFSIEILGAHTYAWALFIFWASILTMGVLLMMLRQGDFAVTRRVLRPLDRLAMVVFLVVIAGNILQAFTSTGPPPYVGQGDPVRFSFNPAHWVWSADAWRAAPISLRGRWAIEKPDAGAAAGGLQVGPLAGLAPALSVRERKTLALPLRGTVTDLAYDAASDRFLITTQQGVYIVDASLGQVLRHTVIDPGFSVDLGRLAGAAFVDSRTVVAVSENKSYVVLRENDEADARKNFPFFLESFDRFDEVSRSRLGTVRARMMYVMSAALDRATDSLYTVTVPNSKVRRLVVSRFDRRDWTLSEEFVARIAPESGLALGEKRSLDELYVTGTAIRDGRMFALSAACGTLIEIDLASRYVVGARVIAGLSRPTGIAIRGDDLYIASDEGTVSVVAMAAEVP
jgi:disulfide bond formation protein DsbB